MFDEENRFICNDQSHCNDFCLMYEKHIRVDPSSLVDKRVDS